jgi:hypothetical protein
MCRSLENSYSGQGISDFLSLDETQDNFIYFQDCINRFTTSSSVIIHGVKPDEAPEFTTMWAIVGFPLSSLPVPVWLTQKGSLPELVKAGGRDNSELSDLSLVLKNRMVPAQRSEMKYYINTTKVANAQGSGITQKLKPVSDEIIRNANEKLAQWRKSRKMNQGEVEAFYNWTDAYIRKGYSDLFNLRIQK